MATITARRPLWFFDNLVRLHQGGLVELSARAGDMPPLHVHHTEDELFYVLEGELSFFAGDDVARARAGETLFGPASVPHVYRVESERARWLVFTSHGRFSEFVRATSRPAEHDDLPPHVAPTPEQVAELSRLAAQHGIDILGPPGTLPA
jgi:mannose-6-phosphate isomerase-like protein (cupin superfamily)